MIDNKSGLILKRETFTFTFLNSFLTKMFLYLVVSGKVLSKHEKNLFMTESILNLKTSKPLLCNNPLKLAVRHFLSPSC